MNNYTELWIASDQYSIAEVSEKGRTQMWGLEEVLNQDLCYIQSYPLNLSAATVGTQRVPQFSL